MSIDKAWLLGSGGWIPTRQRATCCALIRSGGSAVLIDAGTGIQRLLEKEDLLDGLCEVDLVLTHFHLDHVVGLGYLAAVNLPAPPRIFAPGRALFGTSSETLLQRLVAPPMLNSDPTTLWREVIELSGDVVDLPVGPVALRRQDRHSCPTLGLRFGDELVYCTDTAFDEATVDFARGARVLAHDAWWSGGNQRDTATHTSGEQAGRLAASAECESLVLIHVNPLGGSDEVLAEASHVFENSLLGSDLTNIF